MRIKWMILFFVLMSFDIKAQSYLGFRAEPFYLMSSINSNNESKFYSTSFYCVAGLQIFTNVEIEISPGIIFSEGKRYNAYPELGVFGKYFLREGKEYVRCGLLMHFNKGESSNSIHLEGKKIYLGSVGVGTTVNKNFLLEIMYQFPIGEKQYSLEDQLDIYNNHIFTPINLIGLIKLGFGLSFDL